MSDSTTPFRQLSIFDPIQLPLTKGAIALIDPIDADLASFKWYCNKWGYAVRDVKVDGKRNSLRLGNVILERIIGRKLKSNEECDHENTDSLDNQRSNLRLATSQQNKTNRHGYSRSGYKGVYWHKGAKKWRAMITVNYKVIHLGYFDTPEDAHAAYCKAAIGHFGEFARLD